MALRAEGPKPGDMVAETARTGDPLARFPRMIHMHRWDDVSLRLGARRAPERLSDRVPRATSR